MIVAAGQASFASPLSEHEVLLLLVQLVMLVGAARLCGGFLRLLGQPPVVGELLAGVLLGPSVFGRLLPAAHAWVFGSPGAGSVIFGLAWLGVIMLLVVIGYETDLAIIARFRRAALAVSGGALMVPLALFGVLAFLVPREMVGGEVARPVFAGFFALALSVSALPVVAKILQDLGFLRRNFGQITLAAGMTMDAVGWLLLAGLSGIAQEGFEPALLGRSLGGLVLFVAFALTVGRWLLDHVMRWVLHRGSSVTAALSVALVSALLGGVATQALRLEAILGAFIVGILLARIRHQLPAVREVLETTTTAFFAPVFFAFSGLRVDIGLLGTGGVLAWTVTIIVLAVVAKLVGAILGGRVGGVRGREAFALGSGLSALGAMGIVVALVGLNLGVLTEAGYTVLVVAAIVTSLVAPQLLRIVARGWEVPEEERARLEAEALRRSSEILASRRILLPTRGGRNSRYAARVITSAFEAPEVTVLAVDVRAGRWPRLRRGGGAGDPKDVLAALGTVRHRLIRRQARDPAEAIAREARLGYDLVLLGASEEEREGTGLFSSVVDRVLALVDVPAVVVRFPAAEGERREPHKVLVPVAATRFSRAAEELAYSLVRRWGGRAFALHVVSRPDGQGVLFEQASIEQGFRAAHEMVAAAAGFGERLGVVVETGVKVASHVEEAIAAAANQAGFDVLVLGASNRGLVSRPFFGHRIGYIIEHVSIPVVVVALP